MQKPDGSLLSKTVFDYDTGGRIMTVTKYGPDGSIHLKRTFAPMNVETNQTVEYIWGARGESLANKIIRKYDSAANVIEILRTDTQGNQQDRQVLSYNSQ